MQEKRLAHNVRFLWCCSVMLIICLLWKTHLAGDPMCYSETLQIQPSAVANPGCLNEPQVVDFRGLGGNVSRHQLKHQSPTSHNIREKNTFLVYWFFLYTRCSINRITGARWHQLDSAQDTTPGSLTTSVHHGRWKSVPLLKADCRVKTKETSEKAKMERDALDINLRFAGKTGKSLSVSPLAV